jgi:hypothetical protein
MINKILPLYSIVALIVVLFGSYHCMKFKKRRGKLLLFLAPALWIFGVLLSRPLMEMFLQFYGETPDLQTEKSIYAIFLLLSQVPSLYVSIRFIKDSKNW